jgi:hypothetical protein
MVISQWSVVPSNPYAAPEVAQICIAGVADMHKGTKNKPIKTSRVAAVSGRVVTTASGTLYRLGAIDPDYRKFLKLTRPDWDWRNPIAVT